MLKATPAASAGVQGRFHRLTRLTPVTRPARPTHVIKAPPVRFNGVAPDARPVEPALLDPRAGIVYLDGEDRIVDCTRGGCRLLSAEAPEVPFALAKLGIQLADRMGEFSIPFTSVQQIPSDSEIEAVIEGEVSRVLGLIRPPDSNERRLLGVRDLTDSILRARRMALAAALRACQVASGDVIGAIGRLAQAIAHHFHADHTWLAEIGADGKPAQDRPLVEILSSNYSLPAYGYGESAKDSSGLMSLLDEAPHGYARFQRVPPNVQQGRAATETRHHFLAGHLRFTNEDGVVLFLERSASGKPWTSLDERLLRESSDLIALVLENLRLRGATDETSLYLDNILRSTDVGVLAFERNAAQYSVCLANSRFCELFGVAKLAVHGLSDHQLGELLRDGSGEAVVFGDLLSDNASEHTDEIVVGPSPGRVLQRYSTPTRDPYGSAIGRIFFFRDITHDKEVEQQLLHSQKMESVGTLAGGIAHDFNNLLTTVLGYAELIRRDLDLQNPAVAKLEQIERSAKKAAELTSNLLAFSRRSPTQFRVLDPGKLAGETIDIIRFSVPSSIEIEGQIQPELPAVEADETQIQQVLVNLAINARDALPEAKGRIVLRVRTGADTQGNTATGRSYVVMEVEDNGIGISQQDLPRIFEPFYTTKEVGHGTGLGLSMVYGIVKQHGGFIEVASAPGEGSVFSVYLPASEKPLPEDESEPPAPLSGGPVEATILVVDDEKDLLEFCVASLESKAREVLSAGDGQEALEIVERRGADITLVVLDLTMPRMGGVETFYRMRKIVPDLCVVVTSGYGLGGGVSELLHNGAAAFLQKPYSMDTLHRTIDEVLATHGNAVPAPKT